MKVSPLAKGAQFVISAVVTDPQVVLTLEPVTLASALHCSIPDWSVWMEVVGSHIRQSRRGVGAREEGDGDAGRQLELVSPDTQTGVCTLWKMEV